ncbi:LysR family transcriptional regulator [Paraburkholderia sp. CNPSo 3281]|uniref:LysR family transcriptional regulator n=1 Tax=Paraburkholderia sp. CNPSo 3281 TaxID=2940933 RepID=UPI0020B8D41C|nr:LysR family transcriptional regulator [Paraburkholderia sp. CNPSo 3281]MCP3719172.1 LysR family transcriptional regulator [Paraburkholderia sp. CNPSo 3281]
MDFGNLDLNLLVVFDAMFRHRNVTVAGRELGLSQPAMSYALLKMRAAFDDPLFVRVKSGMQPTPRALAMVDTVRDVLQRIQSGLLSPAMFDPASSNREFRIATSDVGESFFTPPLMRALRSHGQHLQLRVFSLTPSALEQQLESGDVDLAVGYYPDLVGADFYQQGLFTSHFVAIAAKDNRHVKGKLTMTRFLQAPHVDVATPGRSQEIILRHMVEKKIVRNVPLQVSRFLSLLEIVSQSDLIAIVPRETGELFRNARGVAVHALPFDSPTFRLRQHWHKRFHDDAAVRWLRVLVHELFQDLDSPANQQPLPK